MSASAFLNTISSIESLYEAVVEEPDGWNEQSFADWASDTMTEAAELPKEAVREIRRSLRAAQKLATFWSGGRSTVTDNDDWETKVDIALGARAWRPLLDLARVGLNSAPSPELFEQVQRRFALVNSDRWMDGMTYEQWLANN